MEYELEDLERLINSKYQRKMINALLENDAGVGNWILNARFRLRSSLDIATINNPSPEKEIPEARLYLQQWLEDANASLKSSKLEFFCAFEIAESLFASEAYDRALPYYQKAQSLLDEKEDLKSLLDAAKDEIRNRGLNPLSLPSSLPVGSLPRSTLCLVALETKLHSFIDVLQPSTEKLNEDVFLTIDGILSSLNINKSNQEAGFSQIIDILEKDLTRQSLYFDFRLHLATLPSLAPIADRIRDLNIAWRIINTEEEPSLSWMTGVRDALDIFNSLLARFSSFSHAPMIQSRFYSTLRIIATQSMDETMTTALASFDPNFQSTLTPSIKALKDSLLSHDSRDSKGYEEDAFIVLTRSRSAESLKTSSTQFSAVRGALLTTRVIQQRIKECEANRDFDCAVVLYSTLRETLQVNLFWDEFMARLCATPSSYSDLQVLEECKSLFERDLYPSSEATVRLALFLLKRPVSQLFDDFGALLQRHAASPSSSFLRQVYNYAKHILDLWKCVSGLHPSLEVSQISESLSTAATHFEAIISVAIRDTRGWAADLLGQLRNADLLKALASISIFSLDFLYRSSKLPCEALHTDRINKTLAALSGERDHSYMSQVKAVKLVSLPQLHDIVSRLLFALQRASPNDPSAPLCLGDLALLQNHHETALRFYLKAIFSSPSHESNNTSSYESSGLTGSRTSDTSRIAQLLPVLIYCFTQLRLYHYAIVLHQYSHVVDHKAAISLMATWGAVFPRHLFSFIFDLPLLEMLAHTLKNAGNLAEAHEVAALISKPEHVALEFAPKALEISRSKFLLHLAHHFLEDGNWNGESS